MMIDPNPILWVFEILGNMPSQKITIKPNAQKQTKASTTKMSKNRLLGDFCLSLLYNMLSVTILRV